MSTERRAADAPTRPTLHVVILVPSRYEGGAVQVFRRGLVPNSTAGFLAGLCEAYNERRGAAPRAAWRIFDEHVETAVTPELLWRWKAEAGAEPLLVLVTGIQTNNYPRGRDIALMAVREGIPVVAGGVHLSCHGPSVDFLVSCGVSVSLGESETFFHHILLDAAAGRLAPLYRIEAGTGIRVKTSASDIEVPALEAQPFPIVPDSYMSRFVVRQIHVDASRGCPFLCTFCAVKNAFGRNVRARDPDELAAWIAERVRTQEVRWFDFTDDNFRRNPRHMEVLERLAALRESGLRFHLKMMADIEATCYAHEDSRRGEQSRRFLELCRRAGVRKVYVGIETTTDESLIEIRKNVNRVRHVAEADKQERLVERFRRGMDRWHEIGAVVASTLMLGLDSDTRSSGLDKARDAQAIGVDFAYFLWVTPLPGAENYAEAVTRGTLLHRDFNQFFYEPMLRHPTMTTAEVTAIALEGNRAFYTFGRMTGRVARAVLGIGRPRVVQPIEYLLRQVGTAVGTRAEMFLLHAVTGGLGRRKPKPSWRRAAVTDEEARAHYLPGVPPRPTGLPAAMMAEGRMDSLPILRRHVQAEADARAEPPP